MQATSGKVGEGESDVERDACTTGRSRSGNERVSHPRLIESDVGKSRNAVDCTDRQGARDPRSRRGPWCRPDAHRHQTFRDHPTGGIPDRRLDGGTDDCVALYCGWRLRREDDLGYGWARVGRLASVAGQRAQRRKEGHGEAVAPSCHLHDTLRTLAGHVGEAAVAMVLRRAYGLSHRACLDQGSRPENRSKPMNHDGSLALPNGSRLSCGREACRRAARSFG